MLPSCNGIFFVLKIKSLTPLFLSYYSLELDKIYHSIKMHITLSNKSKLKTSWNRACGDANLLLLLGSPCPFITHRSY